MSAPTLNSNDEYFESFDSEILWIDKPGDSTVRPCRPERLEFLKALRARYIGAEAAKAEKPIQNDQDC